MDYRKRLKRRIWICTALMVVGAVMKIMDICNGDYEFMFAGFGIFLAGASALAKSVYSLKNEEFRRKSEIAETDERYILIDKTAKSMAATIYMIVGFIASVVLDLMGMSDIAMAIAIAILVYMVLYTVIYIICGKKM